MYRGCVFVIGKMTECIHFSNLFFVALESPGLDAYKLW